MANFLLLVDFLETLCERHGFNRAIKNNEREIKEMIAHLFEAYQAYYGKYSSPPIDVIKKSIKLIIEVSPEVTRMKVMDINNVEAVINRVVEKIYFKAEKSMEEMGYITRADDW